MRQLLWSILFLSGLLFSACIGSENPLSQLGEYENDPRLAGTWFVQTKDGSGYIHFSRSTKEGWIDIASVGFEKKGGLDIDFCKAFSTHLKNGNFLNAQCQVNMESSSEKSPEFQILFYEITSDNELSLKAWNGKYIEKSIEEGRILGRINQFSLTITDGSSNLVKFIQESDIDQLFVEITKQDGAGPLFKIQEPPPRASGNKNSPK